MSVYRTLRLRGLDPTKTITAALRTYLQTGKLPRLPELVVAVGTSYWSRVTAPGSHRVVTGRPLR